MFVDFFRMVLTTEDKALIKNVYLLKGYGAHRLLEEFQTKNCTMGGLDYRINYLKKINILDELQQRLVDVWQGMQQSLLDNAIDEWLKRLRSCIQAK